MVLHKRARVYGTKTVFPLGFRKHTQLCAVELLMPLCCFEVGIIFCASPSFCPLRIAEALATQLRTRVFLEKVPSSSAVLKSHQLICVHLQCACMYT